MIGQFNKQIEFKKFLSPKYPLTNGLANHKNQQKNIGLMTCFKNCEYLF